MEALPIMMRCVSCPRSPWPLILEPGPAGVGRAPLPHLAASRPLHCQGLVANGQVQPPTPIVSPLPRAARLSGHNGGHGTLRRVGVGGGDRRWVPLRGRAGATGPVLWGETCGCCRAPGRVAGFCNQKVISEAGRLAPPLPLTSPLGSALQLLALLAAAPVTPRRTLARQAENKMHILEE